MNKQVQLFDLSVSNKSLLEINKGIKKIISKKDFILGEDVKKFEKRFSNFLNSQYTLGLNSGTDSLEIALRSLDIGPGDEVIVPSFSFFASSEVILKTGAQPIYCDINLEDLTLNLVHLKNIISEKTKAVIAVHLFGNSVDLQRLKNIVSGQSIYIIEDVAQAFGSTFKDKYLGSIGEFGCFSFYPTKILGAYGDGGFILTNDYSLFKRIKRIRFYGIETVDTKNKFLNKYYSNENGVNSRLDEIQSSILNFKLKKIDYFIKRRRELAKIYLNELSATNLILPKEMINSQHVYHLFTVYHVKAKAIIAQLKKKNIETRVIYPYPIHKMNAYSKIIHNKKRLINSEIKSKGIFCLPLYPELKNQEVRTICKNLIKILKDNNY